MRRSMIETMRLHRAMVFVLAGFLALGITYSVVTPLFEAGDELWHYPFVQHLATGHALPAQDPNVRTLWEQEGGQPPLYYAVSALATFWIDTRDLADRLWRNPEAKVGIPLVFGNKNLVVHTSAEEFPWHNAALAVHLIRFLSVLFSAFTVVFTYLLALEIGTGHVIARSHPERNTVEPKDGDEAIPHGWRGLLRGWIRGVYPEERRAHHMVYTESFVPQDKLSECARNDPPDKTLAAFAAALVAFNPMFIFISASVNNDNLAVMLATLALWLLARLITRGATMQQCVALGVVLGLAALSKVSDLGLLVVAAIVFLYLLCRDERGEWRVASGGKGLVSLVTRHSSLVTNVFLCAAIVVAIAGWWYARNWLLYGDPLAFNVWVAIAGGRPTPATLATLLGEFQGFRISFWGNFGGVNIIAPDWVYVVLDLFTVLAGIGLLVGLARRALPRLLALPALWLALILVSLVRWTLLTFASQGRLIFPAIGAVAILMAYGLSQWRMADGRWRMANYVSRFTFFAAFPLFLLAFSVLTPFALIAPAYALPARLPGDVSVPNPTRLTFDDQAELVGVALAQKSVTPGNQLPITIYWRTKTLIAEDYSVYLRLFDATGAIVGRWEAFPGSGLYPTRLWQPGEIIVDTYRVPVAADARGPGVGWIDVGLFRRVPLENLTARDPQGRAVTPTIARFKIAGQSQVQVQGAHEPTIFGDPIALVGYVHPQTASPGSTISVTLYWRSLAAMTEDYTVFVHLADANGMTVAQKDDQPQRGAYPTSFWDVGETVADEHALTIPRDLTAGDYRLEIGIYRASDGARLPIRKGGDALGLGTVRIAP